MIATGPGWELRLGDCIAGMRELADDSVDVVITDPPYEAEAHTLGRRQKGKTRKPGGGEQFREVLDSSLTFNAITKHQRTEVATQIARVSRAWGLVFCQSEAIDAWRTALEAGGMHYRRSVPWVKPDAMPSLHGRWPGQSYESWLAASNHNEPDWEAIVLASQRGAQPCPVGGKAVEYRFARDYHPHGAPHETTKPLALMLKLVEHFTKPGDLVLDAFTGSATTGIACLKLGRRFLGFELSRDYFDIACRRLRGEEAKPNPAQPSLFGGAA